MAEELNANVGATTETAVEMPENGNQLETEQQTAENPEIARLKAELAKQKAAIDKATKEASDYKKLLRAKQSEEEIAAEEKRIADEARDNELADLRKRFAVAEIGKKVMALGGGVEESERIAELLYGAEDVDAALTQIGKVFDAREKALRLEFGKIPPPGVGGTETSKETLAVNRARDIGKAKAEADKAAYDAMKAYMR